MEIEALFGFAADLGEKVDTANKHLSRIARSEKPIHKPLGNSFNSGSNTQQTLIIDGTPAAGRVWFMTRFGVFGSDGHTAVAGVVVDVYAGFGQEAEFMNQIYSGLTVPTIIEEGRYHNFINQREQIYAIFYNMPSDQDFEVVVKVAEYPSDIEAMVL